MEKNEAGAEGIRRHAGRTIISDVVLPFAYLG